MTGQIRYLVETGRNGTFRADSWQYGLRVVVLRQSEERHFLSSVNGKLEKCYTNFKINGEYRWRDLNLGAIPERIIELIENPSRQLEEVCRIQHDNSLLARYAPKKMPSWTNGIYVTLPPTPVAICKGWILNDFAYRFMEVRELK
jgi:hypothetical protein